MWIVREELPEDREAVHALVAAAFGRRDEADLVDRLRTEGEIVLSLVAERKPRQVGDAAATGDAAAGDGTAGGTTDGTDAAAPSDAGGVATATIAGHILFSPLPLSGGGHAVPAAALAPLSVVPEAQGRGVGETLVREGLARLEARGVPAVIVLGDPDYYRRFGFRADLAARLVAPFSGGAFMAIELVPGVLSSDGLEARYASAFGVE